VDLVKQLGGEIVELAFLIELTALKGRERLKDYSLFSLIQY
jgi:adenine phosphoribosyltransferase